jgi:long-chain acyl-CoA synthetase
MTDPATLTDLFYTAVARDKPTHLQYKPPAASWKGLSSAEFRLAVEQLSEGLVDLGVQPGDKVAILSENCPEWAIVDFAVLAAQAVDAPIYPTLTAAQVAYILNDSEAKVAVVSNAAQAQKLAGIRDQVPGLQHVIAIQEQGHFPAGTLAFAEVRARGRELLEADPDKVRRRAGGNTPDALATLIYTSGTTGDPKGVMLTHDNLVSNVVASLKAFPVFGPDDTALSFLPLCHSFERMAGHYLMLHAGAAIAYAESVEKVADNMREVRPTVMCSVPRLYEKIHARILEKVAGDPPLRQKIFHGALAVGRRGFACRTAGERPGPLLKLQLALADALVFGKIKARTGGRLKLFVSGGAPLAREIAEFFGAVGLLVCEGYGLTETSPVISVNRPDRIRPGTVGPPIERVEVKIAEDGEILTRGPHVMKGYFKKPEATAEAIDPEGWFHTGDVGFLDDDGHLVITDRKKDLIVTSGGKNIAPQPIENAIKTHALIGEVVMVGNRRNFPAALVVPAFENLEKWAAQNGGARPASREELIARPEVVALYEGVIEERTRHLASFEKIKKIALVAQEFSVASGELTPTLKVKRRVVEEKFKPVIDRLYA